jgi:Uncharacterized conserved protein
MRHLYKLFHEKSANDFDELYRNRFDFDSAFHLGMDIKPMNQPYRFELFYVPTNEMLDLTGRLCRISKEFDQTFKELPKVAQEQFIKECLVEELYNTNELEGIRSTREEIARSTKEVLLNKKTKKRFESMIKSYYRLLNNEFEFPKTPQDIRQIYDDITQGEIEQQELPDGDIFRKETTYILKKSGSGKVVHQGVTPESEIIHLIGKLLAFMNDDLGIPNLIKVALGHYYFGYIHPFYDGNGRTSRFISSMYLSRDIGNISTLSLSRGCNKFKNKYLEAFEIANSIRTRGEMNHFIEAFLGIIVHALEQMNAELKEKSLLLNLAMKKLNGEPKLKGMPNIYSDVMFVLAQNHFFDAGSGLTIKELAAIYNKSDATMRKIMKELLALSLIEQQGEKPAYYFAIQQYFES